MNNHLQDVFKNASKVSKLVYHIGELEDLRKPSKEVNRKLIKSKEIQKVINDLKNTLKKYRRLTGKGRGVAAIQIGIPLKIAVIFNSNDVSVASSALDEVTSPAYQFITIINPKIIRKSGESYLYPEICMSANPIIAPLKRPCWIEFEYLDENGNKQIWNKKDNTKEGKILNRVFQHEIDHMEGIINIDKVPSNQLFFESDPAFYKKAKFEQV